MRHDIKLDFTELADRIPGFITIFDVKNDNYVYVSKGIQQLLGYDPKQLLDDGKFLLKFTHKDDLANTESIYQKFLKQSVKDKKVSRSELVSTYTYRIKHKDGHWVWIRSEGRAFSWNKDGSIKQVLNISSDITEAQKTAEQLDLLNHELEDQIVKRTTHLALALKASQMGTWEWDIENNTLHWSDELMRQYGLNPKTDAVTLERYRNELIHPDDRAKAQRIIEAALETGRQYSFEHRVVWPDESNHWMHSRGKAILRDGKSVAMVGTSMNIDALKAAEEKQTMAREHAELSEQRFKQLFEYAPEALFIAGTDGRCEQANQRAQELLGYTTDELIGKGLKDLIRDSDLARLAKRAETRDYRDEWILRRKDGSEIFTEIRARRLPDGRWLAFVKDLSNRVAAQQALKNTESRFRELADSMPQIVWTASPDGRTDYYNRRWYEYTGLEPTSTDYDLLPFLHPDDIEHCHGSWKHALETGKQYQAEYRLKDRRHPGSYRWFLAKAVPVTDENGVITKWYGTSTDIDTVKRAIKRKNELEDIAANLTEERKELLALNAAKDEFISLVSHQLRTPATGVKQYIGMLLQGYFGDISAEHQEILQRAYDSNERQLRTVNDMLLVARVDANKIRLDKQPADIVALIEDAVAEQTAEFTERQQTVLVHAPEPVSAIIDSQYMRMVVDNLIENARKYTYEKGSVKITVKQQGDIAVISVMDTGVGIHPDDHSRLFQKFARIDNPLSMAAEGTGLGLYWSRKIVDMHHGSLHLTSELGKGSTFIIRLPIDGKVHAGV